MMLMENMIDYDNLIGRLDKAKEDEETRFKEARRQRNVAAFVDFATNLLSLAAYKKGARYRIGTSHLSTAQPQYLKAKENYNRAMNDYKGKIAEINLLKSLKKGRNAVSTASAHARPIGFIGNGSMRPQGTLLTGQFEAAYKNYKNKYNGKN